MYLFEIVYFKLSLTAILAASSSFEKKIKFFSPEFSISVLA